jgi:hypothetical protein
VGGCSTGLERPHRPSRTVPHGVIRGDAPPPYPARNDEGRNRNLPVPSDGPWTLRGSNPRRPACRRHDLSAALTRASRRRRAGTRRALCSESSECRSRRNGPRMQPIANVPVPAIRDTATQPHVRSRGLMTRLCDASPLR